MRTFFQVCSATNFPSGENDNTLSHPGEYQGESSKCRSSLPVEMSQTHRLGPIERVIAAILRLSGEKAAPSTCSLPSVLISFPFASHTASGLLRSDAITNSPFGDRTMAGNEIGFALLSTSWPRSFFVRMSQI